MFGSYMFIYPVVMRERFGARDIRIPLIFPVQLGSQGATLIFPSNSYGDIPSGNQTWQWKILYEWIF